MIWNSVAGRRERIRLTPAARGPHARPAQRSASCPGRRVVPRRQRRFGWIATVSGWDVEHHEVELVLERGVVQDVQARVRRTHLAQPEEATR